MLDVDAVIDLLGGTNKVARLLHIRAPSVSQWRARRVIPEGQLVRLAARIERESEGSITRQALFPDEWERIWPELAPRQRARAVVQQPLTLH